MAAQNPDKMSATLVRCTTLLDGNLYLTDLNTDFDYDGNTYLAHSAMQIDLPGISGGMQEKEAKISLYVNGPDTALLARLATPYAFAPVTVDVFEILFDEYDEVEEDTEAHLFHGKITSSLANKDGKIGIVEFSAKSIKDRLDSSLGITCNVQCSWLFGDKNCKAVPVTFAGTVAGIGTDGHSITLTEEPPPGTYPSTIFNRGFIEYLGTRILVRKWSTGRVFATAQPPHPSWIGKDVLVHSGCDKNILTCDGIYDNLDNFAGLGFLMASHNPTAELP